MLVCVQSTESIESNKNPGNYMYGDNETPITVHSVTIGGRVKDQYTDKPFFGQPLLWNYTCYRTLVYTKIYILSVPICVPKTVTFASWLRPLHCFAYKCPTTAVFRQTYHNSAAK